MQKFRKSLLEIVCHTESKKNDHAFGANTFGFESSSMPSHKYTHLARTKLISFKKFIEEKISNQQPNTFSSLKAGRNLKNVQILTFSHYGLLDQWNRILFAFPRPNLVSFLKCSLFVLKLARHGELTSI